jgi:SAM-dependent methyltransferase
MPAAPLKPEFCDLCSCSERTVIARTRDYRYGEARVYEFVQCSSCNLIYMLQPLDIVELKNRYMKIDNGVEDSHPKSKFPRRFRLMIDLWHRFKGYYSFPELKPGSRFLDIGCAYGLTLERALEFGAHPEGVELNALQAEACRRKGLKVHAEPLENVGFSENSFDTIWISQVLEHVVSATAFMKEVARILKPKGRVYVSCPNGESYLRQIFGQFWEGWYAPFHNFVFIENSLKCLAQNSGLSVESISTKTPVNFLTTSLRSFLWAKTTPPCRPVESFAFLDSFLFAFFIAPILRCSDMLAAKKGDCLVAILRK